MRTIRFGSGDSYERLAWKYGFDPKQTWEAPENDELRELRSDPSCLCQDDLLRVPDERQQKLKCSAETANAYVSDVPRQTVSVKFLDLEGTPFDEKPCVVYGLGEPLATATKKDGTLAIDAGMNVEEVRVEFEDGQLCFTVRIAHVEPMDDMAGVRQRLTHLGYGRYFRDVGDADPVRDAAAIAAFQRDQELDETGELDEPARAKLLEVHGF